MLNKILIANRGEIAVRVIRACRELGKKSVAVYSEGDRESRHVALADEAVCIGPASSSQSYLRIDRILAAAKTTGAEAIHPGYGFLAENSAFARAVAERGLVFIGPSPQSLSDFGDKIAAREIAQRCGVPLVPGTVGKAVAADLHHIEKLGFPVLIKAAAGGGGKGLRVVREKGSLAATMERASAEAKAAFGDGTLYVEKLVHRPRHVEIQILADQHGGVVAAVERDCSVQRRHQKLIEESPSPAVTPAIRRQMQEAAIRLAKKSGYIGAGTVEFLLDPDGKFYFIEVNARLQVEHPVTEEVTGLDLVAEQIRIAEGERLHEDQDHASEIHCHAIEHRINAEDPERGFAPCPGLIESLELPCGPGTRVDTHLYQGYTVPPHYDSLLAKLIVCAQDRKAAVARSLRALSELRISGISTTAAFHQRVLRDPRFGSGDFDTHLVDDLLAEDAARAAQAKSGDGAQRG
ncbi:MAG: acetyl-CoA carboxylase biotin carboxylase subunit [Elusimicrobia bacterium GWA2_69_24]|nr:MAG: acetyl-CoA carboxylase biotin carboxylase subunit [Elusimicrobia bacterium GWA2_69_24]HBL16926.1 acetyl-CoA carboxylase biotin carboxylase subunit [Elusimicrobiota bacterium]